MKYNKKIILIPLLFVFILSMTACSGPSVDSIFIEPSISKAFQNKLNDYADLIMKLGLNVQPGQKVVIKTKVENQYFANICLDKAYEAGASDVVISYDSAYAKHEQASKASSESLKKDIPITNYMCNEMGKEDIAYLKLISDDPHENDDLTQEQIDKVDNATGDSLDILDNGRVENRIMWIIAAVPNKEWAKTVFPNKSDDDAVTALWNAIFESVSVTGDGQAASRMKDHWQNIKDKEKLLNNYHFKNLKYENSLGTNLTVELPKNHVWSSAWMDSQKGAKFVANIPTEEVFTSPLKNGINGTVYSSKPLVLNGKIVNNFHFDVKNGKIVDMQAEQGEEVLKSQIERYENADYFGEVSLVPDNSTISKQNILYYSTLYDENASCHMALGRSFPECIKGGLQMTQEQLEAEGINSSDTHVDFMIGTDDLKIVGTTWDGKEITVFENGEWAI